MQNQSARFGFISYFINRKLYRVPVEFFMTGAHLMAWLDGYDIDDRLWTAISPEMDNQEIGDFGDVMELYKEESISLFKNTRLWQECIQKKSGLLLLFRAMHEMRIKGLAPAIAINSAIQAAHELKESERTVLREIATLYTFADCVSHPERLLKFRPAGTPISEGIIRVA